MGKYIKNIDELSDEHLGIVIDTALYQCLLMNPNGDHFLFKELHFGNLKPMAAVDANKKSHIIVIIKYINEYRMAKELWCSFYGTYLDENNDIQLSPAGGVEFIGNKTVEELYSDDYDYVVLY